MAHPPDHAGHQPFHARHRQNGNSLSRQGQHDLRQPDFRHLSGKPIHDARDERGILGRFVRIDDFQHRPPPMRGAQHDIRVTLSRQGSG
ncbi:MAG: hypothetical protein ABF665_13815 [Gluconacetobacter sp.]